MLKFQEGNKSTYLCTENIIILILQATNTLDVTNIQITGSVHIIFDDGIFSKERLTMLMNVQSILYHVDLAKIFKILRYVH